jgi:hypothetical protein
MKKSMIVFLVLLLGLQACSKKKDLDDFSKVENKNSNLLPLLLNRSDFDAGWDTGYAEVTQHLGGGKSSPAEEYASYGIFSYYPAKDLRFVFVHALYLNASEEIDPDTFFGRNTGNELLPIGSMGMDGTSSQCFDYQNINRTVCVVVTETHPITSVLMIEAATYMEVEDMLDITRSIVESVNDRLSGYGVK